MQYQTLLSPTSPLLAELEAKLGSGSQKPGRLYRQATRLCVDGRIRGAREALSENDFKNAFWNNVIKMPSGCWEWTKAISSAGYGLVRRRNGGKIVLAHRFVAEIVCNINGLNVLHTCDNPKCVNPSHLFLGTFRDNTRDMINKSRCGRIKLNWEIVRQMRTLNLKDNEMSKRFGISRRQASDIRRNKSWAV